MPPLFVVLFFINSFIGESPFRFCDIFYEYFGIDFKNYFVIWFSLIGSSANTPEKNWPATLTQLQQFNVLYIFTKSIMIYFYAIIALVSCCNTSQWINVLPGIADVLFFLFFFKWNVVSIFQYAAIEKYLQKYVFHERLFWNKAFLKPRQKSLVDEVQFF